MSSIRLALALTLGALTAALPATAHAGSYHVQTCHPDGATPGWQLSHAARTTAYVDCNSLASAAGIRARNVIGNGIAPGLAAASASLTAPRGTYFDWARLDIDVTAQLGWQAGLYDFANKRWLLCGATCATTYGWLRREIALNTSRLGVLAICGSSSCETANKAHGSVGIRNVSARVQDPVIPTLALKGGSLLSGRWLRAVQTLRFAASDNAGLRSVRLHLDGRPDADAPTRCDFHLVLPCTPALDRVLTTDLRTVSDGTHSVALVATDAASNVTRKSFPIRVDNTPPGPIANLASDARGWVPRTRFNLRWANPARGPGAPVTTTFVQICGAQCAPVSQLSQSGGAGEAVEVPASGHWRARLWMGDEAGNADPATAQEVELFSDTRPPSIGSVAQDPARPGLIEVVARDDLSGIATAELEIQRSGESTWRSVPVSTTGRGFAGVVDDGSLPAGRYLVRARATDGAGNEQTLALQQLRLPFRAASSLTVGRRSRVRDRADARRRTVLVAAPHVRFGARIWLHGRLTTSGKNALAGRDLEVAEQLSQDGSWVPIGSVRTDSGGRFKFRAPSGPSRRLRFRYPGSSTVLGRTSFVDLRVRAMSTLRVDHRTVVNGEAVTFSGTVFGEVPTAGKLMQLQVFSRGAWLTFATPRADRRGRWSFVYRFTATRGVTRYRFRARLPRETGFPYSVGRSRQVRVKVVGQ